MTQSPRREAPAGYEIRVDGHLDDHWSAWFDGLTLTHQDDGTTSLTGVVSDQAELHGLLTKVRDLGVTLISVAVVDHAEGVDHQRDLTSRLAHKAQGAKGGDSWADLWLSGGSRHIAGGGGFSERTRGSRLERRTGLDD